MTDTDLKAQLASIQTSLRHLEEDMKDAQADRRTINSQLQNFMGRLTMLEAGNKSLTGIPDRVAHTEAVNEVQEAISAERASFIREIRLWVFGGIGATATVVGLITYFGSGV